MSESGESGREGARKYDGGSGEEEGGLRGALVRNAVGKCIDSEIGRYSIKLSVELCMIHDYLYPKPKTSSYLSWPYITNFGFRSSALFFTPARPIPFCHLLDTTVKHSSCM